MSEPAEKGGFNFWLLAVAEKRSSSSSSESSIESRGPEAWPIVCASLCSGSHWRRPKCEPGSHSLSLNLCSPDSRSSFRGLAPRPLDRSLAGLLATPTTTATTSSPSSSSSSSSASSSWSAESSPQTATGTLAGSARFSSVQFETEHSRQIKTRDPDTTIA